MQNRTMWHVAQVFLGLLATAAWADAQPVADDFSRLHDYLRLGDAVILTDLTGRNLRGTVHRRRTRRRDRLRDPHQGRCLQAEDRGID